MASYNSLLPLAMLTVMMFLIWTDSVRTRPVHPVAYILRALVFVAGVGILLFNRFRYPHLYGGTSTILIVITAVVGIGGAAYFGRKAMLSGRRR